MKKLISILIFFSAGGFVFSQDVISTQGDVYQSGGGEIAFTIGEVVINTVSDGSGTLTQGFHQTLWNFSVIGESPAESEIRVYPNPAGNQLNIQTASGDGFQYAMFDMQGRLVVKSVLTSALTTLNIAFLENGTYSLRISDNNQKQLKTISIIKNN